MGLLKVGCSYSPISRVLAGSTVGWISPRFSTGVGVMSCSWWWGVGRNCLGGKDAELPAIYQLLDAWRVFLDHHQLHCSVLLRRWLSQHAAVLLWDCDLFPAGGATVKEVCVAADLGAVDRAATTRQRAVPSLKSALPVVV